MTVEAGGDHYARGGVVRLITKQWYRMSQDGGATGDATKRECRLLDEIITLKAELWQAQNRRDLAEGEKTT